MKIALFGAGKDGIKVLHNIARGGDERVCFFIDNNREGEVEGIPIVHIDQFPENEKENILILVTSRKYKDEMIAQLKEKKLNNFLVYTGDFLAASNYNDRLSADQWGNIYNESIMNGIVAHLEQDILNVQTEEMIRITQKGEKILEIGCGSGETSLALSKRGRLVTAIDYSSQSYALVNKLIEKTGYAMNIFCIDALKELPFVDGEFDTVFQAGLLEHFEKKQRINMLSQWRRVCKRMVSLIPNAHCVAYRAGKMLAEKNNTWPWGLEIPQSTLIDEFEEAGYVDIKEYSVGERHALNFLSADHYLRVALEKWMDENTDIDDWGQGYLLVTIANNPKV